MSAINNIIINNLLPTALNPPNTILYLSNSTLLQLTGTYGTLLNVSYSNSSIQNITVSNNVSASLLSTTNLNVNYITGTNFLYNTFTFVGDTISSSQFITQGFTNTNISLSNLYENTLSNYSATRVLEFRTTFTNASFTYFTGTNLTVTNATITELATSTFTFTNYIGTFTLNGLNISSTNNRITNMADINRYTFTNLSITNFSGEFLTTSPQFSTTAVLSDQISTFSNFALLEIGNVGGVANTSATILNSYVLTGNITNATSTIFATTNTRYVNCSGINYSITTSLSSLRCLVSSTVATNANYYSGTINTFTNTNGIYCTTSNSINILNCCLRTDATALTSATGAYVFYNIGNPNQYGTSMNWNAGGSNPYNMLIYGNVLCPFELNVASSKNIKNILKDIDESLILELIEKFEQLEIYQYQYIDKIVYNNINYYGLIAEQVKKVFPDYIYFNDGFIPNIYDNYEIEYVNTNIFKIKNLFIENSLYNIIKIKQDKYYIECKYFNELDTTYFECNQILNINEKIFIFGMKDSIENINKYAIFEIDMIINQYLLNQLEFLNNELDEIELQNQILNEIF